MLEKLREIKKLQKEFARELLRAIEDYQFENDISYSQMAKICGLNVGTFSNLRSNMRLYYIFPSEAVVKKLLEAGVIEGEM